ncbi:MAG: hypothetical protein PF574_09655 [Candidatus Delongbacteria bacterium]|jgi:hypothetical protein|nr:hypothetical protein [Candidatus Delongbacteria bacterium]
MYKNIIFIILLMISANFYCFAEQPNDSKNNENKTEYMVLPFGYYNPTTSFGFGLYSIFLFKENVNNDRSKLRTEISYTLNEQIIFRYKSLFYLKNSKLYIKANVKKFISDFYGLSNSSDINNESFSYFSTDFFLDYNRNFYKEYSYSLLYDLDYIEITKFKFDGILNNDGLTGKYPLFNHCIGFGFNYEKITKKFYRDGVQSNLQYLLSAKQIGSDNNFSIFSTDIKYFVSHKQSSINLQFITRFSFNNVPFTKLSTLGGTYNLRGYPDKRFTDQNMMLLQGEYDFRIYQKIAGAIYYSFGDVFDPFSDLKFNKIKQGYGIGLLYDLLGTAVRVDIATSPENEIQIIATGSRAF